MLITFYILKGSFNKMKKEITKDEVLEFNRRRCLND